MLKLSISVDFDKAKEAELKERLQRILMKSMYKMQELAVKKAPKDRGFLRENIDLFPEYLSSDYELISRMPYSEALEFGNKPMYAPLKDLIAWTERKGIKTGKGVYPFAKYVQKKIKEKGVNAQPFMRPAYFEVINFWVPLFTKQELGK